MISTREAYGRLKLGVNHNGANSNIDIDIMRGIMALNKAYTEYFLEILDKGRSTDKIDVISKMLVPAKIKRTDKKSDGTQTFSIDANSLGNKVERIESVVGEASKGNCQAKIQMYQVQVKNSSLVNSQMSYGADWDFRVAPYTIAGDKINVEAKDMDIGTIDILYYRHPTPVDIKGYTKDGGVKSTDVEFEVPDTAINQIIEIAIKNILTNNKIIA